MNDETPTRVELTNDSFQTGDQSPALEVESAPRSVAAPTLIESDCESIRIKMLTLIALDQEQINTIVNAVPGGAQNVQNIYPLSPQQEGMLFQHLLSEQSDAYVLSTLFELQSRGQVDLLINALQKVIQRHDILRSAVMWQELPRSVQVVCRRATLPVEELVLNPSCDPIEQLNEQIKPRLRRMDLKKAPLMRLLVAAAPKGTQWYAILRVHHLICDHESLRLVVAEAMDCVAGREQELPLPGAFRDYVVDTLANVTVGEEEAFFRSKLADIDEPTAPFGLLDAHGAATKIEEARQGMDPSLAQRIRVHARRSGVSAAILFHAAWGLVVAHTSGRDDVVYGTVLLARTQQSARAQRVLGMSVNTLPLRMRLQGKTAQELVEHMRRELAELVRHEAAPLTLAQRCSGIVDAPPLFTSLLNYRHSPAFETEQVIVAGIRVLARCEAWTNYPVALSVDDLGADFVLTAHTDRRIDAQRIVNYLGRAIESLMEALEQAPQTPAMALSILPEIERRQVIELFNATHVSYPHDKLVHELFEEQVRRTPGVVAVMYEGEILTYAELNGKANQLARYLRSKGIGPDQLVGICVERSLDLVIGLLGILKAGGAYVPLDPTYPPQRLQFMVEDASPRVVLTQGRLKLAVPSSAAWVVALDDDWKEIAHQEASNLDAKSLGVTSDHLAYVIYTSGSTGQPKGVMVQQRNVMNLWQALERGVYRNHETCKRISVNASLSFDASVQQWVQLLSGRSLVIVPQAVRMDAEALMKFIERHQIEGLDCTPAQLSTWVTMGWPKRGAHLPKVVLVGGEAIDALLWERLTASSSVAFYNVYGPTECTVDSTVTPLHSAPSVPHIGCPISNAQVYILDSAGEPVPIGVSGEIHIGGAGVARGYLNRAELTQERFIADRFGGEKNGRLYKTGDLGRWRADGNIEYLGRNDQQVKVRGYRIELGEIEAQLARHEQVKEAVVIAHQDSAARKRLVAYVTQRDQCDVDIAELRAYLKALLPEYMVPSAFVTLDRLPLTENGKLDRRALLALESGAYANRDYEVPQGDVEEILAGIWQELLRVERVGRQDDFFGLGGDSLTAIDLIVRLADKFSIQFHVQAVLGNSTFCTMAKAVERLLVEEQRSSASSQVESDEGVI